MTLPNLTYSPDKPLIIGTRGSQLALWQAHYLKGQLQAKNISATLKIIKTSGDRIQDRFLKDIGGKGLFTKELEEALINKEIDLAIHSLKDVPVNLQPEFCLGAILPRHDPRDSFIVHPKSEESWSKETISYEDLKVFPKNTVVATGSLRRQALLGEFLPQIDVEPIRGNVDTRLEKLKNSSWKAIILAKASLDRLQIDGFKSFTLDANWFIPAPGQGALAIETLKDHQDLNFWLTHQLHCKKTALCVSIERALLAKLGGDCTLPLGCFASMVNEKSSDYEISLVAFVGDLKGKSLRLAEKITCTEKNWGEKTEEFYQKFLTAGAGEIITRLKQSVSL